MAFKKDALHLKKINSAVQSDNTSYATVRIDEFGRVVYNDENGEKSLAYITDITSISAAIEDFKIVGGDDIRVVEDPDHTWTISVSGGFATKTDLDDYTLLTTTETISTNLQNLQGKITSISAAIEDFEIVGGDGILVVEDPDHTWTVSVSGGSSSNIVTLEAGQNLSAYRAVFIDDDGLCYYASPSTDAQKQIFLVLESKSLGEFVKVALNGDVIFNLAWSFIPGSRLFVTGTAGQLSQTAPITGNIFSLGVIIEPTKLQIQNQNSIVQAV